MKALSLLILILATTAHTKNFTLTKDNWIANIHIEQCDEYQCEGKSRIELNTGNYQQVFTSDNAFINSQNKNIPFQFSDFLNPADYNFDGKTDIAISQGNYGLYGSTIYNIYVQTNTGKFILSDELSDLTLDYMGLPEIDNKNHVLVVFNKVGYNYHDKTHYRVLQNQNPSLQKVYFQSTEYTLDDKIIETTEILKHGKIHKTVTTHTQK